MKIGIIGRTKFLLDTAERLLDAGHDISFVWTSRAEAFYGTEDQQFEDLAKRCNAHFVQSSRIKMEDVEPEKFAADVCVSVNFVNIIPKAFRDLFSFGVLNAHAGDLPRYRGNACANWAILNNEPQVALTIHEMADALDAGPIYVKSYLNLNDETYIADVYDWLGDEIPSAFSVALKKIEDGHAPSPQAADIRPLRTFPRKPQDSQIDWRQDTSTILRLIRASSHPFDGAFTTLNGDPAKTIHVFRAETRSVDYDFCAIAGQLCFLDEGDPVIACGDGLLRLTDIEGEAVASLKSSLRNRLV